MTVKKRVVFVLLTAVLILLSLTYLSLQNGRTTAQSARLLYLVGDCQTALPRYEQVSRYPVFAGQFVAQSAIEAEECQALVTAEQTESSSPADAINAYEQFLSSYPDSPLTTPALAAIHRLYLDWGTAERQSQHYTEAIAILEKATTAYPALEAETEERILQSYLAWGEALQTAGDNETALTVYNELKDRYPQFTAEAQAGIERVNGRIDLWHKCWWDRLGWFGRLSRVGG